MFSAATKEYVNIVFDKFLLELPPIEGIDNNMNIIPSHPSTRQGYVHLVPIPRRNQKQAPKISGITRKGFE